MTLRRWLLLAMAYVLALAIVSLEVPLALNVHDRVDAEVRAQARSEADVVAATAAGLLRPPRPDALRRLALRSARAARGRVVIVDERGRLVADSGVARPVRASYLGRPEIRRALGGRSSQLERRSRTLDAEVLATAVPVLRGGRPAGAVRVTQSVAAVNRVVRRNVLGLALLGGLVLLLGLIAAAFVAGRISQPMRRLEGAAGRVAAGDLDARATPEGSSEQRALARAFNRMTERLARMFRAQREFIADASHGLRTPLTGLRLRLEEALTLSREPAARAEIEAGLRELDRLAAIVDELLVLSRAGERDGVPEPVDLGEAGGRALERWRRPAAEAGLELSLTVEEPAQVTCSASDLDRAVDALVENAVLYSPPGRQVELAARGSRLEVLDRGPGLAPGEEERVLERFHRGSAGRRGAGGSGLGLAIAAELAAAWGGAISISNRPGGGAQAVLSLPPATEPGGRRTRTAAEQAVSS